MTLEAAVRLTEILLALALIQQGLEHLAGDRRERWLFAARTLLCGLVIAGVAGPWPLVGLGGLSLLILTRFQGPYNGGSDRMGLLALWCLIAAQLLPTQPAREVAFGYLGFAISAYLPLMIAMIATGAVGNWLGEEALARAGVDGNLGVVEEGDGAAAAAQGRDAPKKLDVVAVRGREREGGAGRGGVIPSRV